MRIPQFLRSWTSFAISTSTDRAEAEESVLELYDHFNLKTEKILWVDDPVDGCLIKAMLKHSIQDHIAKSPYSRVNLFLSPLTDMAEGQNEKIEEVHNATREHPILGNFIRSVQWAVYKEIERMVKYGEIKSRIKELSHIHDLPIMLKDISEVNMIAWMAAATAGTFNSSWVTSMDYLHLNERKPAILESLVKCVHNLGMFWGGPITVICEKPKVVSVNENGFCSRDAGAIEFSRSKAPILNNVQVPEWLAYTPSSKIDPKEVSKIENAEIRREFVRKVGIERICHALNCEVVDRQGEVYELILLDIGDGRRREYLKMRNPSIDTFHVEGVPPGTKTVQEALEFRNGTGSSPLYLT